MVARANIVSLTNNHWLALQSANVWSGPVLTRKVISKNAVGTERGFKIKLRIKWHDGPLSGEGDSKQPPTSAEKGSIDAWNEGQEGGGVFVCL